MQSRLPKRQSNIARRFDPEPNPEKAYNKALKKAKDDDVVLVCGSLYLASDVKKFIK